MTCPILSARGLRTAPNPETYSLKETAMFRPFGARSLPQLDPLQLTSPSRPVPWLRMGSSSDNLPTVARILQG